MKDDRKPGDFMKLKNAIIDVPSHIGVNGKKIAIVTTL